MKATRLATVRWLVLTLGVLLPCSFAFGADASDYQKQIERMATNWQAQFGPIDFAREEQSSWMIVARPQSLTAFRILDGEHVSPGISSHHQAWIRRIFKGALLNALTNLSPTKFYLNEGRPEPSLLYCELELEGNRISIQESYEAFLVTVRPRLFDARQGIDRAFVGRILFEWVNLNKRRPPAPVPDVPYPQKYFLMDQDDGMPFAIAYNSQDELLDSFRLPAQLKVGDTFSNWPNAPRNIIHKLKFWQAYVVGFVGSNGVSLILLKVEDSGPRIGRLHDFNWLNKGLFQADGKTLVDPPRNREDNESPEFREPWRLR